MWFIWSTCGGVVMFFTCDWCDLVCVTLCNMMSMALFATILSNVAISLFDYVKYDIIYLHVKSLCVLLLMLPKLIMLDNDFDIMSICLKAWIIPKMGCDSFHYIVLGWASSLDSLPLIVGVFTHPFNSITYNRASYVV